MKHAAHNDRQFWLWSALVHVILFALVLLSPAGELILRTEKKEKPEIIRQGEELNEVVEDIRDLAVERLKAQVELLDAGQDRMADNFETLNKFYQPFADLQRATARKRFTDEVDQAKARMQTLITALEAAKKAPDDEAVIATMNEAINANMARLLTTHDEVKRSIMLRAADDTELMALQQETFELQLEANKFFSWAMHEAGQSQRVAKTIATNTEQLPKVQAKLAHAQSEAKRLQEIMDTAQKSQKEAEEAKRTQDGERRKLDGQIKKAESTVKKQQDSLNKVKKATPDDATAIAAAQTALDQATAELAQLKQAREQAIAAIKAAEERAKEAKKLFETSRNQQRNEQKDEREAQRSVDSLTKGLEGAKKSLPEHTGKRDYCIGKSADLQRNVAEKLDTISERFLTILDAQMEADLQANPPGTE